MGNYIGGSVLRPRDTFGSMRIGTNGSGPLLVEQWIAGWILKRKNKDAAKAITWLQYFGDKYPQLKYRILHKKKDLALALTDDSQDQTWVRGWNTATGSSLAYARIHQIHDRELHALLCLWTAASTMYEFGPYLNVTKELASGVLVGTEGLEEQVASWAGKAREACTIVLRTREKFGYISIG